MAIAEAGSPDRYTEAVMTHASKPGFHVLYVCWANQCRSPIAELLLASAMRGYPRFEDAGWRVSSAGVAARTGRRIDPSAARVLAERGVQSAGFTSRPLRAPLVGSANLILTAERAHRSAVLQVDPGAAVRTFTMRQFARLVGDPGISSDSPDHGPALVQAALDNRGLFPPRDPQEDDIADPVGRPVRDFRRSIDAIAETLRAFDVAASVPSAAGRPWWHRFR